MLKPLLYFGYYLRVLNWDLLRKFQAHYRLIHGLGTARQWILILINSLRYKISILEFYQFDFFTKSKREKEEWAGTGFMYEFQRYMNPVEKRDVLENKILFAEVYLDLVNRTLVTKNQIKSGDVSEKELFPTEQGKSVLKPSRGGSGKGIEIWENTKLKERSILKEMDRSGNDMLEEFVVQHEELHRLSPSGLNTLRVVTQIDSSGKSILIAARLRISVNSVVDNLAAGNIVTAVDLATGKVVTAGFYSDITKEPVEKHPITGTELMGFQVPHWEASKQMALDAASRAADSNKSVGWDIGITERGPVLIEGNHDWCKLVWQLPIQKGLKAELQKYL